MIMNALYDLSEEKHKNRGSILVKGEPLRQDAARLVHAKKDQITDDVSGIGAKSSGSIAIIVISTSKVILLVTALMVRQCRRASKHRISVHFFHGEV